MFVPVLLLGWLQCDEAGSQLLWQVAVAIFACPCCQQASSTPAVPCLQAPVLILSINQQAHTLLAQLNHHNLKGADSSRVSSGV